MTLKSNLLKGACLALVAAANIAPAQAVTPLYSGGGTLAEKVYRDMFNCYGFQAGGDTTINLSGAPAACNGVKVYRPDVQPLYVGVGSGNGKLGLVTHDASQFTLPTGGSARTPDNPPVASTSGGAAFGPFYGTGTGAGWVAGTANPFPAVTFAGSDDPLTAGDITKYNTNSSGNWGPIAQFPALVTAIAIPFNPTATWTPNGVAVTGASSNVNITTDTLCGIFSGAITDWSDPAFKAGNQGSSLGNGAIHVFWRNDGSGSTFLTSNALLHQCGVSGNASYPTPAGITHPLPANFITSAGNSGGANNNFWINIKAAGNLPANYDATGAKGSGGIKTAVNGSAGAIAYLSPDFVRPVDATGPLAANLQDFTTTAPKKKPKFLAPTGKNATAIVAKVAAPSFAANSCAGDGDGVCAHDPVNWAPTFPQGGKNAYPIGGFTFIDTYSCYADAATLDALAGTTAKKLGLLRWYYGSGGDNKSVPKKQLPANGFAVLPTPWITAINTLLFTDSATKIEAAGAAGKCSAASGA